jgi:hypothetical protein
MRDVYASYHWNGIFGYADYVQKLQGFPQDY